MCVRWPPATFLRTPWSHHCRTSVVSGPLRLFIETQLTPLRQFCRDRNRRYPNGAIFGLVSRCPLKFLMQVSPRNLRCIWAGVIVTEDTAFFVPLDFLNGFLLFFDSCYTNQVTETYNSRFHPSFSRYLARPCSVSVIIIIIVIICT